MKTTIKCPECGKLTEYTQGNKYRPFCSSRCRLIDLGEWIEGKYKINSEEHCHTSESLSEKLKTKH